MAEVVSLYYTEAGKGSPVVLLHGFPFDHTLWRSTIEGLKDRYRLIAPDLRGHGQSPAPAGDYDMALMAEDVLAVLDALDIRQAVWVGHSMGGYVTLAALRAHPQRVAGAVLLASHPFADAPEKTAGRRATAEQALSEGTEAIVSGMVRMLFSPGTNLESMAVHAIRRVMLRTSPVGVAGALRGMANRADSLDVLRAEQPPKALIAGREDQIVRLADLEQLVADMPHLSLQVIDGAGHVPMIEQPQATTAALRAFLDALPAW